jgi:chloramphenicol-sensitive protein RarD
MNAPIVNERGKRAENPAGAIGLLPPSFYSGLFLSPVKAIRPSSGAVAAAAAYTLWGFFPVYWRTLLSVPALELLGHRVAWSLVLVGILQLGRRDRHRLAQAWRRPATLRAFVLTAMLLGVNWLVYLWANNHGHIVEASLGYFITPLINVVLGLLVLRERLRRGQMLAVSIAAVGVGYLILHAGGWLWISFVLAFSFGLYGLLRKTARLDSLEGLSVEMAILFWPALGYLLYLEATGQGALGHGSTLTDALLVGAGVVTAVPLLLFAYGARRIPLSALGILQYIAPTLQFLLGVFVYGEPFTTTRLIGFAVIWLALAVYTVEGFIHHPRL